MINFVKYLLYSFSLVIIWAFTMVDVNKPGPYGILLALTYTYYSYYIINMNLKIAKNSYIHLLKFGLPGIYLIAYLATFKSIEVSIISPLVIAYFVLILGHFLIDIKKELVVQYFTLCGIVFYSFILFNVFESWEQKKFDHGHIFDFRENELADSQDSDRIQLFQFIGDKKDWNIFNHTFLDENKNETILTKSGKPVLIETWNERCIPCIRAMESLGAYFESNSDLFSHYYIYEPDISFSFNFDKVFNFKYLNSKTTLIDSDNRMYDRFNLSGFPYFILFDRQGNVQFLQFGYLPQDKDVFTNRLEEILLEMPN